jgi:hypothetical protein
VYLRITEVICGTPVLREWKTENDCPFVFPARPHRDHSRGKQSNEMTPLTPDIFHRGPGRIDEKGASDDLSDPDTPVNTTSASGNRRRPRS